MKILLLLMKLFRTITFKIGKEEMVDGDKANRETFVMSPMCKTIEKDFRNRMRQRNEDTLAFVKQGNVQQSLVFTSQLEELEDILREWDNIRMDILNGK